MPDTGTGAVTGLAPKRLSLLSIMAFSATSLPTSALGIGIGILLKPHLATNLGVTLPAIGTAWLIVRFLDLGIDLGLGAIMDRYRWRMGRYRVWFALGAPVLAVGVAMLFFAPPGVDMNYLVAGLFVLYLGTSILGLAHAAWRATLITSYNERSRVYGLMAPIGIIGALCALAFPKIAESFGGSSADAVHWVGWFVVLLVPLTVAITLWRIPEPIAPEVKRASTPFSDYWDLIKRGSFIRLLIAQTCLTLGPGWMGELYVFFFTFSRGFSTGDGSILLAIYVLAGVVGAPLCAMLATKFGKHRTLILTTTMYSVGLCSVLILPKGNFLLTVPTMIWCGFMASGFDLMISAMVADFGDQIRLEQGKERITLLYAGTSLAAKVAGALQAFLIYSVILTAIHFNATRGAVNTPEAIHGLEMAYIIGPIFFVLLGGACFIGWTLTAERHGKIRAELDARDALGDTAPILETITGEHHTPARLE